MVEFQRDSFTIQAEDNKTILDMLLVICGYSMATYSNRMSVDIDELEKAPLWAIMGLCDIIDMYLKHLGYIIKDTRSDWMFNKYSELELLYQQSGKSQPVIINVDAVTGKNVGIDLSLLVKLQETLAND